MKKKTTVQSINKHSTPPSEETKIQKHEVPGLMTLSDSILSGAVVEYRKAGYSFARHLHTNIEIYRILSGECYMDIQSETIHCTEGEFIMLLPDVIHSFYLNDTSDCEFQHIHFNPEMFSTIVLEDEGVFPITLMHAILFSAQFYYRMESDPVINEHLQKLITLYASSNSLFSAANINVALINLMLYILDHTETEREFSEPQLQNSYVAYTLNYVHYIAYTRPGQYDVHGILPTEGGGEELTPSVYEQFIARVVDSANAAAEAAKRAASGEANAKQSASEAAVSAQQTAASATLAAGYAEQAEAAADRAASYAPSEGAVLSVNGKSGAVRLNALDVWALPRPVSPKVGQLVRVVKVDASTGALTVDTISTDSLSGLGSEEKELLLKLLGSVSYTDSSAKNDLEALKKLWDTTPPTPLPDPDIIPVEKVTLSQHTLELSRGSTADLSASIAPPDATDQTVLWSVSPTDIVSVDAGRVTALKKGSAVVTATSDSKSDSCTVTVTPAVYRIETAHTDSGDIPAWDTYPAKSEFFMPLTAKKAGLLLRSLEFRVKGYMPGKMRTVLRKYGTTTALADKSIDLVRGYNDVVLDMGSIALEKGVEYQLYFAASNNFYPPSVQPSWVAANDCIDIAHGSAYYGDDATLIFSGTVVLQET